jgi:hypothetical protein
MADKDRSRTTSWNATALTRAEVHEGRSPQKMKIDLNKTPLFLLVAAEPDETREQCFAVVAQTFDPRLNDPDWGPLYQIGPKYELDGRPFFQIQTAAGSLGFRMLIATRKGEFSRAVAVRFDTAEGEVLELAEPNGSSKKMDVAALDEQDKSKDRRTSA